MGKLLQKLVNGIGPSWLTKVKSSPPSSPKKLLPFFSNHTSSNKSPFSSTQQPPQTITAEVVPALTVEKSTTQDESSTSTVSRRSSSSQRNESEAAADGDSNPHAASQYHSVGTVKEYKHHSFQNMLLQEDNFSQSQNARSDSDIAAELLVQSVEEKRKELQHMQEDIHYHAQSVEEKAKELQHEDMHHSQDGSLQETQWDFGYHENACQGMLGLKRKSGSLQSDDGKEDEEELEEGRGGGARDGDVRSWVWKRRKGEKGVMSCELPESICSIVGNGRAVVKQSLEPHLALWESMVEMIVGNGLWELGSLEFLLYCYLSLNETHLHPIIQSGFLQVLKDLERIA